uniref:Putative methyltransferase n=1 Tax=viral metagenome TaxID=1070528 RepID=A0A6M3INS7_9ZZZZ
MLEAESIDALVTDPPAGIAFMGKKWDGDKGGRKQWIAWMTGVMGEVYRVMKPGAHGLVWALPRTSHWTATALEDAGFEIRDICLHIFGTGFPKSHNVGKAIDQLRGNDREKYGISKDKKYSSSGVTTGATLGGISGGYNYKSKFELTKGTSEWEGWGTALKPAAEHWILIRKPISEKTIAANVLKWGVGGINIDGCRVAHDEPIRPMKAQARGDKVYGQGGRHESTTELKPVGRWPANITHDGSEEVLELFPQTTSGEWHGQPRPKSSNINYAASGAPIYWRGDSGSAARFFYCAKSSKRDRDEGCEELAETTHQSGMGGAMPVDDNGKERDRFKVTSRNNHPTVKATALMRWLCRLITPPNGIILDPFMGSGSTGKAATLEGFNFIGIEQDTEYLAIAEKRIAHVVQQPSLFVPSNKTPGAASDSIAKSKGSPTS